MMRSLLGFIFFFSGFASLMYQIAWQRLLTVHYGVGAISITAIVSVYMFGLGSGALIGGALAERVRDRIRLYFLVQLLLVVFGLASVPFLAFLGRNTADSSYILSFWYMSLYLIIPTTLMGITLPLLTKIFNGLVNDFLATVSYLYFINTIGAACGTLFASYMLISFFGLHATIYCAVGIDIVLAGLIFHTRSLPLDEAPHQLGSDLRTSQAEPGGTLGRIAYPLVFITGFLAIGYELVWLRLIGVLVKASPYAFSSVLAIYLLGIGIGSLAVTRLWPDQKVVDKRNLFFLLQCLVGLYVAATFIGYYYLTRYTPLDIFTRASFSTLLHPSFGIPAIVPWRQFFSDTYALLDVFFWPLVFVFIPTILMGASFPLIAFLSKREENKEAKTVGTVYFFGVGGQVLGGILTGFVLLPMVGTSVTVLAFAAVGMLFGLLVTRFAGRTAPVPARLVVALAVLALTVTVWPKGNRLYDTMHGVPGPGFDSFIEEGREGVIVTRQKLDTTYTWINGLGHGGRPGYGFYYEAIEGLSLAPRVENVLIVGFGTGSITEAMLRMEGVRKITIVELNEALVKNLRKIPLFTELLDDDRVELVVDDGRRFLLRTDQTFDIIQIDALRATTSYSNNLYSRQFFELVNQRLNDGGVFMVWMDEFRVIPKTLLTTFDYVRLYDFFGLASNAPFVRNDEVYQTLLGSFSHQDQNKIATWGEFVGDERVIEEVTVGYRINEDWSPVTEYYLGLRLDEYFRIR